MYTLDEKQTCIINPSAPSLQAYSVTMCMSFFDVGICHICTASSYVYAYIKDNAHAWICKSHG